MSEPNSSFNSPESSDQSNSLSADAWYSGWDDFVANVEESIAAEDVAPSTPPASPNQDEWHTVDFPNTMSVNHLENHPPKHQSDEIAHWSARTLEPHADDTTAWADLNPAHQPRIEELISLIQELNQCNGALLERVSQLEDALEQTQQTLPDAGIQAPPPTAAPALDEAVAAQDQTNYLFSQLEYAQQTQQRQQILIETLTAQLENSQERIAQLERECALTQQRYNEQTHVLMQSDNSCRDLRVRLHRQQRYTLQFKAALEKCLEVPAPSYGLPNEASAPDSIAATEAANPLSVQPLLPKVQRIQPWSSQPKIADLDWNLAAWAHQPADEAIANETATSSEITTDEAPAPEPLSELELPQVMQQPVPEPRVEPTPTISYHIKPKPQPLSNDQPDETLEQQLQQALDWGTEQAQEIIEADGLDAENHGNDGNAMQPVLTDEAEAALWQDLARLIDISSEDVLKASLATDFAAFESSAEPTVPVPDAQATTNSDASPDSQVGAAALPPPAHQGLDQPIPHYAAVPSWASAKSMAVSEGPTEGGDQTEPFAPAPSWPSPVVYPLRPQKKRESLAAVDLPTFPR